MKERMNEFYWYLVSVALMIKAWITGKMYKLQTEGASHFVEILVAIIIVIAVGAVFKNQIINFINSVTGNATAKANELF